VTAVEILTPHPLLVLTDTSIVQTLRVRPLHKARTTASGPNQCMVRETGASSASPLPFTAAGMKLFHNLLITDVCFNSLRVGSTREKIVLYMYMYTYSLF